MNKTRKNSSSSMNFKKQCKKGLTDKKAKNVYKEKGINER